MMDVLNTDQVNLVSRKLVDWLRYASIYQGVSMSSGGFFTSPRTRQVKVWRYDININVVVNDITLHSLWVLKAS